MAGLSRHLESGLLKMNVTGSRHCRDGMMRRLEPYGYKKLYNLVGVEL